MESKSQYRRISAHQNATVADITHATGVDFKAALEKYRGNNQLSRLSIYHNAAFVDKQTKGLIARLLAEHHFILCTPIRPASTLSSMCRNLNINFIDVNRSVGAHTETRMHFRQRVLGMPREHEALRKTIAEYGAIVVFPKQVKSDNIFDNLFGGNNEKVMTLQDLQERIFIIDRIRLIVLAPIKSTVSKLEYPGEPLRTTAMVSDLLARINESIGATGTPDRGVGMAIVQPNGEVINITTETITDHRKLSLSHLRWP